jgi:DNA-binding PadR family transcriptional regulator
MADVSINGPESASLFRRRRGKAAPGNPKTEIRDPKEGRDPKSENGKIRCAAALTRWSGFRSSAFGFLSAFGPRPSGLAGPAPPLGLPKKNLFFPVDIPSGKRHSAAMLSKELVAASTVPLVLSVLAQGENYGYALIQQVRELSDGRIEWTEGMLYPVLHWMQKEKLIEAEWREAETGRKRKYYRIRKEGHAALGAEREQWLTVHQTLNYLWKTQPLLT